MVVDGVMIPIIALLIVPVTAIGFPLARAYAKRMEQGGRRKSGRSNNGRNDPAGASRSGLDVALR